MLAGCLRHDTTFGALKIATLNSHQQPAQDCRGVCFGDEVFHFALNKSNVLLSGDSLTRPQPSFSNERRATSWAALRGFAPCKRTSHNLAPERLVRVKTME